MFKYDKYIINNLIITKYINKTYQHKNKCLYEQIAKYLTADNSVLHNSNANDMRVTQDLNSFGDIV
jgi:hypothetical protein